MALPIIEFLKKLLCNLMSGTESLTANNLVLAVYRHVTNPECRQYLLRQAFEEAVHTDTFIYCCDSLGLNPDEIYNMYLTIPSIEEKDNFVIELTKSIFDPKFEIKNDKDIQTFLHDLIGYYVIMEGIFFYAGFAMMLALKRSNKMVGIGQQFEFIMRDESLHLAVELEKKYALDACPEGVIGINAEQFSKYVEYVADRRLERIGEAGTGKSFLLKYLIGLLRDEYEEELFITSYTGRTAINIHGQTLHSFAGIGATGELDWHGNLFDKLEIIARQIKGSDKPFGGIQLIICVRLNQIYRQNDNQLITLLQDVRDNRLSSDKVNQINFQELAKLPTFSITYCARDKEQRVNTLNILAKDLAPEKLELKIGAQVMLTINQFEKKLFNGSQGIIVEFKEEDGKKYPLVKFT
ncbi:9740_t:CDS:2, partial [Ambispora gerdemannii]